MAKEIIKLEDYDNIRERFSLLTQEWNGIRRILESPNGYIKFNASNKFQTYIVPDGVTKIHAIVVAARGASAAGKSGGNGGKVECDINVTPGQKLYLYCGKIPSNNQIASYNASDIRTNKTALTDQASLQSRLVVAGGGGSSGAGGNGGVKNGGAGGGTVGANGYYNGGYGDGGSTGGTQSRGGTGGTKGSWWGNVGQDGTLGMGGNGGAQVTYGGIGGAGGAGYYGGGGGSSPGRSHWKSSSGNGGAGGSSYANSSICSNIEHSQGFNNGNGYIIISKPSNSSGVIPKAYRDRQYISSNTTSGGYVKNIVPVETKKIHTLGNENNIRRSLNNAYEQIYELLKYTDVVINNGCYLIGEETSESTTAKPFSDEVLENEPYNLSEVKKTKTSWCTTKDDYIVTYDIDSKRKLELNDFNTSMLYDTSDIYIPYIYNDDMIFIKGNPKVGLNDVYKLVNNEYVKQTNQANYIKPEARKIVDSTTPTTKSFVMRSEGYAEVTLIGAGGGGGGGSWKKKHKHGGGGGGSGAGFIGNVDMPSGTYTVSIGKGGNGGTPAKYWGTNGENGGNSNLGNLIIAGGGPGGTAGGKHTGYDGVPGGTLTVNSSVYNVSLRKNGNPGAARDTGVNGAGASVYKGYGKGGYGQYKSNGTRGVDGYGKIIIHETPFFDYLGNYYIPYKGSLNGSIVFEEDYNYLINRLNALEDMFKSYRSKGWFDSSGYCQTSCQTTCQTPSQKS